MITATMGQTAVCCCPKCGFGFDLPGPDDSQVALLKAQRRIEDLEAQIRLLNQKATAAVDRWADYEDELAKLRGALDAQQQGPQQQEEPRPQRQSTEPSVKSTSPTRSSFLPSGAATRISAFLSSRKSVPNLQSNSGQTSHTGQPSSTSPSQLLSPPSSSSSASSSSTSVASSTLFSTGAASRNSRLQDGAFKTPLTPLSPAPSNDELISALTREQTLRRAAECRLSDTSREVEELSVQLFEQANEMVATERRARAALEARVETLERREADKRRRLERLEGAIARIESARAVLTGAH
ncbi:hypothetical protein VTK73DRAFT_4595 [Phialemonium thermophilum]|uniref:GDP/GTP exchange factor Sec2 N-terminal domain-containing protein n=1 Tax=Phialemonium thermophilum TaxID=223376 RepID=A0ABR3XYP5_9PEZI